nr:LOW QUALITY PROTEIN: leucine-rich repeat-containing protein 75B-like [Pongo abelii]
MQNALCTVKVTIPQSALGPQGREVPKATSSWSSSASPLAAPGPRDRALAPRLTHAGPPPARSGQTKEPTGLAPARGGADAQPSDPEGTGRDRRGRGGAGPGSGRGGPGERGADSPASCGFGAVGARLGRQAGPEAGSEAGAAAGCGPAPYQRRVRWLRKIHPTLRELPPERARQLCLLRLLRQDLGLERTLLPDILYRDVAFLNLVDPISHDLLVNLARDLQCPKKDYELWKSSDKICRQLIYHLTPHSKQQQGSSLRQRKTQTCLRSSLQKTLLAGETVDLSGIPLSTQDVQHITRYLSSHGAVLVVLDLSFTGLSDELLHLLLPSLWALPCLTQLLLNGNRLTWAIARKLTDAIKGTAKFPALAWVDLGNNVDVASLPQPLLVGLRRRLSQRTSLPTIYEGLDLEPEGGAAGATTPASTWHSTAAGLGPEPQACCAR